MSEALKIVGHSVPKANARELVTGAAVYTADMRLPGMLYATTKRSAKAHARIKSLDTRRAEALPGVAAVLVAKDIPGENAMGIIIMDHQLLATDTVRCRGDNLALIVGEKEVLREAADLIEVEYEPLPVVLDPLEALKDDAPRIHEKGNVTCQCDLLKGDVEEAFARCDVIVEGAYRTPTQEHAYLEPEAVFAVPEAGARLTVYVGCQTPFHIRGIAAKALGLPQSAVKVVQQTTGGSFGGKDDVNAEMAALAGLAALRTGRPVMINHSREESIVGSSVRHASIVRSRTGATADGKILARDVEVILDGGAYSSLSPLVMVKSLCHAGGPYDIPNVRVNVKAVYTNKTYSGAFRGFGVPQVTLASERQMDELAAKLGMDPAELRLKNVLDNGGTTATGQKIESGAGIRKALNAVLEAGKWSELRARPRGEGRLRRGVGLGCVMQGISLGAEGVDAVAASCQLGLDGSVLVGCSLVEMGQGANTVFAQIAAETLGVPLEVVRVKGVDTDSSTDSGATVASRATTMGGRAVATAVGLARERVLEAAARMLESSPGDLEVRDGLIQDRNIPEKAAPLVAVANALYWTGQETTFAAWSKAPNAKFDEHTHQGDLYITFGWGAHLAEVEVDTETGQVTVIRHIAAQDVGKAINPRAVEGQIEGAALQGLAMATLEEILYGPDGTLLNPNFADYMIPTSADAPDFEAIVVEEPGPWGPYGAKGVGEPPVSAAVAAVANAVADALGTPVSHLPVSPEQILELLASRRS